MQSTYLCIKEKVRVGHKSVLLLMFVSRSFLLLRALVHFSENSDIHHEFIASFSFVHMQNLLGCEVHFSITFKKLQFSNC